MLLAAHIRGNSQVITKIKDNLYYAVWYNVFLIKLV